MARLRPSKRTLLRPNDRDRSLRTKARQAVVTEAEEKRYAELQQMAFDFACHGETESPAAMLDAGLPVNFADHKGQTLLRPASYRGHHLATTRLLFEYGSGH